MDIFFHTQTWVSLFTLIAMEVILGIDNIVFISILVGKLPKHQQDNARKLGIFLALVFRVLLLLAISWLAKLVTPLFSILSFSFSGRDLILIVGGLFLMTKSTVEIHNKLETSEEKDLKSAAKNIFWLTIFQIAILDMIFSLDSVITAVGLVKEIIIMVIAVVVSLFVMLSFAKIITDFIHKHPTMKMLALSFLLMIGVLLFAEGFHVEVPKGYIYFAMAFSLFVETLNIRMRKRLQKTGIGAS